MHAASSPHRRHRYPAEIISHTVWLYFRFALCYRDVEEIMAVRGITLTYETIREWSFKFGQTFANERSTNFRASNLLLQPEPLRCMWKW